MKDMIKKLIFSIVIVVCSLNIAMAKRPPTPEDCDPSNWVIDPDVDYSQCEGA
jgi:hypothetical protein